MADYIDREKLIKYIHNNGKNFCITEANRCNFSEIARMVKSEDVAPVVHARWVKPVPGDGDPCCSECKAKQLYLPYVGYFYSKYCPYCGAKMYEEQEE